MRLITWNTSNPLTITRSAALQALEPDVAVLPEANEHPIWAEAAQVSDYRWRAAGGGKGLGVASFGTTSIRPLDDPRSQWVLPVEASVGFETFLLLATWTVRPKGTPSYAKQVSSIIDAYEDELASGAAVIAGDLNCSANTADNRPHLRNVGRLRELGMVSAYHSHQESEPSRDDPGTLFWRRDRDAPYHCDLVFVPEAWMPRIRAVELGGYDEWVATKLSDHVPVIVDIELEDA